MIRHMLRSTTTAKVLCNCGKISQSVQATPRLSLPVTHCLNTNASFSTSMLRRVPDEEDREYHGNDQSFAHLYADSALNQLDGEIPGFEESDILIPTIDTHKMIIGGVLFTELPVAHIKASKNNTIITITDASGKKVHAQSSGGQMGFKNAATKGTVPAQRAGYAIGQNVRREGLKNIRVLIQGTGTGRFASVHGLKLSGLNVISITDKTCDHLGRRPRRRPHK